MLLAAGLLVTLAVAPAAAATKTVTVTTTSLPAATGGVSYSARLAASGGLKPYTWSITQGSLPAGLTLVPATGLIAGRPSVAGTASFTVQVGDAENPAATASANLSITVTVNPLMVTTAALPAATADVSYSAKLAVSGGIAPYTWSVTQGSLPAGLKLDPSTGAISGKPTAPGTASFTVTVGDTENPAATASANLSITVTAAPLVITTTSVLPSGTAGAPYSVKLAASGGLTPYTWSIASGSLPAGLKLHAATGVISGTPVSGGASTFTAQVSDAENPPATRSATFSLGIEATTLQVTTATVPGALAGEPYSATLAASGGVAPYTWSLASGSLPAGLTLDPSTGTITGTPAAPGTSTFTVTVTDSANPAATAAATLTIAVTEPLKVTTTSLPGAIAGVPYSATLAASGGAAPYTWSLNSGSLPAGLTLDPSTGTITGTPAAPGTSTFTVTVTDSANPAATAAATLTIAVTEPLKVTTTSLPGAIAGVPYSATLAASGGAAPYTWSLNSGSLPAGLTLDPSTGTITGTPAAPGTSTFTVTVTDSANPAATAAATLTIAVTEPLKVTTTSLPGAIAGVPYSATLAASGGAAPYTWSLNSGSLPAGLTLDPSTGTITGTPAAPGTSTFTVAVTDSANPAATAAATLTIAVTEPLKVTTTSLPGAIAGVAVLGDPGRLRRCCPLHLVAQQRVAACRPDPRPVHRDHHRHPRQPRHQHVHGSRDRLSQSRRVRRRHPLDHRDRVIG